MTAPRNLDDPKFYEDGPTAPSARQSNSPKSCAIPPDERCAARLQEWCDAYDFPHSTMLQLIRERKGPRITKRGRLNYVRRVDWYAWWDQPPETAIVTEGTPPDDAQ
jgi:hypothetical protein